jgi:hypothetical protein
LDSGRELSGTILERLHSGFKVVSNTFSAGKIATSIAHQRNALEIQKPVEVVKLDPELLMFVS